MFPKALATGLEPAPNPGSICVERGSEQDF